jgi:hypothetical protein
MVDGLRVRYGDLLEDSYDCVDRIVLNAYFSLGYSGGGFRVWWRALHGGDEELDVTTFKVYFGKLTLKAYRPHSTSWLEFPSTMRHAAWRADHGALGK